MEPTFRLRFLGAVQITQDDTPVRGFESRKALALLAYLATQDRPIPREQLVDLFWPDKPESRGRANLSWVLNKITTLLPDCVQADRHTIQFQRAPSYWLDIDAFGQLETQRSPDALTAAVDLYRGEFLEGLSLDGCAEFEVWLVGERERWRQRVIQAMRVLITHHSRRGESEDSLRFAQRLLVLEPWHEETHRQVMRLLARSGQRAAALSQYEDCRRVLAQELGIDPLPETTALYERIRSATQTRKANLPIQPTRFVGREDDMADIAGLLNNPECRLLTLVGPGGVGKTRLALQTAADQTQAFLEGVHFVPLAPLNSAENLASAIAEGVGFSFSGQDTPQHQLLNYLRGKEMLLLLDNFEHLLEGTDFITQILRQAPEIALLVTSREPLNLRWEYRFAIEGLRYPSDTAADIQDSTAYSAIQLFAQIAQRARPRFHISSDNGPAIVRICQLVEGLPLGIEMAAAWVSVQTCAEIADEINDNLDLFATSMRDVPERHRSLRATFEHSWRLLNGAEQHAFAALSVFRGGFQPQAAREVDVCSPGVLESLAEKSLLRCLPSGRCEMHELLRQFAAEKLSARPEAEAKAREQHGTHYLTSVQRQEQDLLGKHVPEALAAIKREMANVRAAWRWAVREARLKNIEQALQGLSRYYALVGPYQEGSKLIEMAADRVCALIEQGEQAEREMEAALSNLLAEQAALWNWQGMSEQASAAAQKAVVLAQASQATDPEAIAHLQWGIALCRQGDYEAARTRLEHALALTRSAGLRKWEAYSLRNLGIVCWHRGERDSAKAHFDKPLRICREIGDRHIEVGTLNNLSVVATWQGDYAVARSCCEQALQILHDLGTRSIEGGILLNLGLLTNLLGDFARAEACYEQALRLSQEIGDRNNECTTLSNLGLLAHRQGDYEKGKAFSQQAVDMARELDARRLLGYASTHLGHNRAGLGQLAEAATAYQEAVDIRQELGQHDLAIESMAGLARVSLAQGELARAREQVDEIWGHVETDKLREVVEPLWIYMTCYQVLKANADPRAQEVLTKGHRLLCEQAAKISDEEMRRSFLENVAVHREIAAKAQND